MYFIHYRFLDLADFFVSILASFPGNGLRQMDFAPSKKVVFSQEIRSQNKHLRVQKTT